MSTQIVDSNFSFLVSEYPEIYDDCEEMDLSLIDGKYRHTFLHAGFAVEKAFKKFYKRKYTFKMTLGGLFFNYESKERLYSKLESIDLKDYVEYTLIYKHSKAKHGGIEFNNKFDAEELAKNYKNIGCIYDTSDPYSKGIYDAFDAKMKELNAAYKVQSFDAENKKDFSTQAEALKDCDVIFTPFYYTEAGLVCKALVNKGSKALVYGCDGLDGIKDQIEGVDVKVTYITPFDVNSKDEKVAKFVNDYKAAYEGKEPDQFAADGYDAIYAIFNALQKSGFTADDLKLDVSEFGDKMIATFTDPSFSYAGVTGTMTWDASGACTKAPQVVEL